jgi:subtilisin family serine protease
MRMSFLFTALCVTLLCGLATADDVRVIIGFKGRADPRIVEDLGATDLRKLSNSRAIRAVVPASAVSRLRSRADVAYVEEDGIATTLAKPASASQPAQQTPWGITQVGAPVSGNTGSGIKVAVIDTGIDLDHPDLQANIAGKIDFTGSRKGAEDQNGHGTHVAGTIGGLQNSIGVVGVAPQASLYAVRVLDARGYGWWSDIADGIGWCASNGIHVANMSLGASSAPTAVKDACDSAYGAGVLLIAAAGNSGDGNTSTTETSYPAAYATVVAVGATNSSNGLASFSNTGSYLELAGPGVSVLSTYKGGGYATLSGTSMASPHAAGMAALLWGVVASPSASSVRTALQTRAQDLGAAGWDAGFGYGLVHY